ncbi:NAD(P)H-binding protein [Paraburkholderia xenovorans]|uniref:NAD(P)H-binding protein n=1 Tax=Paraburkholderia xenovorans TaxID=36873 RepID=UPI0038B6D0D2
MNNQTSQHRPILVTGAAGAIGGIGRNVTEMLLARGHKVRALVRREDERAEDLRRLAPRL